MGIVYVIIGNHIWYWKGNCVFVEASLQDEFIFLVVSKILIQIEL